MDAKLVYQAKMLYDRCGGDRTAFHAALEADGWSEIGASSKAAYAKGGVVVKCDSYRDFDSAQEMAKCIKGLPKKLKRMFVQTKVHAGKLCIQEQAVPFHKHPRHAVMRRVWEGGYTGEGDDEKWFAGIKALMTEKLGVQDLHTGNLGFIGDRLVIFDWATPAKY